MIDLGELERSMFGLNETARFLCDTHLNASWKYDPADITHHDERHDGRALIAAKRKSRDILAMGGKPYWYVRIVILVRCEDSVRGNVETPALFVLRHGAKFLANGEKNN